MKSIKCPRCGMVCWSGNAVCRRCEAQLPAAGGGQANPPPGDFSSSQRAGGNTGVGVDGATGAPPKASGAFRFCKVCYFAYARSAAACPNCGHQPVLTLISKGIARAVSIVLILVLFAALLAVWRYYSRASTVEAQLAAQYGIVDTTVHEKPQQPWFWSLFRSKPTVEEIFAQHTEATGGARVPGSITSQRATGEISVVDRSTVGTSRYYSANGKVVMQSKAPNKAATELDITMASRAADGKQRVRRGFDGTRGWEYVERTAYDPATASQVTKKELRFITGAELEELKHFGAATGMTRLKDDYSSLLLIGQQKVGREVASGMPFGARESYVVRGLNREKKFETFYFDIETGLLTRFDFEAERDGEIIVIECYLEDYRDVGGVKLPFRLSYRIKDLLITINFSEFNLNASISDTVFEMPAS